MRALTTDGIVPGYVAKPMRDEDGRPLVGFTAAGLGPAGGALVDDRGRAVGVILPADPEDLSRWPAVPADRAGALVERAKGLGRPATSPILRPTSKRAPDFGAGLQNSEP